MIHLQHQGSINIQYFNKLIKKRSVGATNKSIKIFKIRIKFRIKN